MFEKKRILFLLATSVLLAACGGGGGDTPTTSATLTSGTGTPANGTSSTPTTTGTTGTSTTNTGNTSTASNTGSTPSPSTTTPATNPVPTATAPADQRLNGYMEMVANQIMYIRRNRVIYLPVILNQLESDRGIVDVAAGSPVPGPLNIDVAGEGCNVAIDGTCGIQPPFAAPAAPIAAFALRLSKYVLPSSLGQAVGNQTVVGRIAVDLTERAGSPGVGANEVPEIMRFIIDKVEMSTNQNGEVASVRVLDGAQIHVYGRNAAGVEVREDVPAPVGTVRILPVTAGPDSHGDTTSFYLMLDLETGFSQAGRKLAALENIAGQFAMHVTLSSIQRIFRPAAAATSESPALEDKDLVGQTITVNDQPPVSGAGLNGNAWIRMYPPL